MTSFFKIFIVTGMLVSTGISAHSANINANIEGNWFLHKFGELRSYNGDFLNVCDGVEFRNCRTVQYGFEAGDNDTFFGNSRLSIARILGGDNGTMSTPPEYTIEIFVRQLSDDLKGPVTLSINGEIFQLDDKDWKTGSPEGYNVAETFSITDPAMIAALITAMRKGDSMRVLYDGWKETRFQLRGISKALDAIEKQIEVPSS